MDGWMIELAKAAGLAAIAFVAGYGKHWLKTRDRERARLIEYEDFKRRRNLVGGGEVERVQRADKLTDLMIKHRDNQITPEEFEQFKDTVVRSRRKEEGPSLSARSAEEVRGWERALEMLLWWRQQQALQDLAKSLGREPELADAQKAKKFETEYPFVKKIQAQEWSRMFGRLDALRWTMGSEWNMFSQGFLAIKPPVD